MTFRTAQGVIEVPAEKPTPLPLGRPGSLLAKAVAAGVALPHACGGFASCGTCHVRVRAGEGLLNLPGEQELATLARAARGGAGPGSRLACQAVPQRPGELDVEVPGGALAPGGGPP